MTPAAAVAPLERSACDAALLLPLTAADNERIAGGKASALCRLVGMGVPVPDGVVLTIDAFAAFMHQEGIDTIIQSILDTADTSDPAACARASASIQAIVQQASIPPEVATALDSVTATLLGDGPVVVRSSAVGEDGVTASFAGQFDSVLHVSSEADLHQALRRCWASAFSARALFYRHSKGLPATGMALLIQRQVPAAVAGVLFTAMPSSLEGAVDDLVVEYSSGLADGLVSGAVNPGRIVIARRDLSVTHTAEPEDSCARVVIERRVAMLARIALHIERELGGPQDVEWAIGPDDDAWIVQARPITTVRAIEEDARDRALPTDVWSNANVSENFPEPISPLLYSIASAGYYHYFRNLGLAFGVSRRRLAAMDGAFRTIVGVHGARLYYNLTNIHTVLRLAPFGDQLAGAFDLFVGATAETRVQSPFSEHGVASRLAQALEAARIAVSVFWQFAWLERRLRRFEATADEFAARTSKDELSARSLPELGGDLSEFVNIRCHRWKNASLCDAAAMVCYAALRRVLARGRFGDATHTRLLRSIPGVPSSQPALRLWALSRGIREHAALRERFRDSPPPVILEELGRREDFRAFHAELQRFLDEWGFRSSGELMLTHPGLDEEPEPVIALLKQYANTEGESPASRMEQQAEERRAETRAVLGALARRAPHLAIATWILLRWTHRAVVARERARLKQALLYTRCRKVVREAGSRLVRQGRLRSADQIFMLTWQEIDEICAGRAMFPSTIAELTQLRERHHEAVRAVPVDDTLHLPAGGFVSPSGHVRDAAEAGSNVGSTGPATTLRGTTACGGWVTARAAVLAGVHESHRLTRGDVLVTRQTDPGWAPVFCLVSGLVIERGGMLSHGAIIAREFGLPCVVGVDSATTRIPHGAMVVVDADAGVCHVEGQP